MSEKEIEEKGPITESYLKKLNAFWRTANYLSAAQLYLLDNPLLKRPLTEADVKKKIVGHWGATSSSPTTTSTAPTARSIQTSPRTKKA